MALQPPPKSRHCLSDGRVVHDPSQLPQACQSQGPAFAFQPQRGIPALMAVNLTELLPFSALNLRHGFAERARHTFEVNTPVIETRLDREGTWPGP